MNGKAYDTIVSANDVKDLVSLVSSPPLLPRDTRQRMDPGILSFIMLSAIASSSAKIERHLKDLEGQGMTRLIPVSVSQRTKKIILSEVWQSVSIANDGDSSVYIRINSPGAPKIPLKARESYNQDFRTHKLACLYLNCEGGETTTLRIVGSY